MKKSKAPDISKSDEILTITEADLRHIITPVTSKAILPLIPIFLFSIYKLFKYGIIGDYLLLFAGSIISIIGIYGYYLSIVIFYKEIQSKQKHHMLAILTLSGLLPYVFACYLVLVRGLWNLKSLSNSISFLIIAKSIIFIVLGYNIVKYLYKLTLAQKNIGKNIFVK